MTDIPELIERLDSGELSRSLRTGAAQALRDLQVELSVWKPNTASEGHGCPACGREYSLEENQAKQIADLQAAFVLLRKFYDDLEGMGSDEIDEALAKLDKP